MRAIVCFCICLAACVPSTSAREWTDKSGEHKTEAEFVSLTDGTVTLQKKDGQTVSLPLSRLSLSDQNFASFMERDGERYLREVVGEDIISRRKAANTLAAESELPPEAADPILSFLQAELATLTSGKVVHKEPIDMKRIPRVGDEISLVRIEADPQSFLDKRLKMIVAVKPSAYYNYGYGRAEKSHYCLEFREIKHDGSLGDGGHLYVSRLFSDLLVESVVATIEGGSNMKVLRVDAALDRQRYNGANTYDLIELYNWQFLDETQYKWFPSALEGIALGLKCLSRVSDATALIDLVRGKGIKASPAVDSFVRMRAVDSLVEFEGGDLALDIVLGLILTEDKHRDESVDMYVRLRAIELVAKGDATREDIEKLVDLISESNEHVNSTVDSRVRVAAIKRLQGLNDGMQGVAERRLKANYSRGRREKSDLTVKWTTQAVKELRFGK